MVFILVLLADPTVSVIIVISSTIPTSTSLSRADLAVAAVLSFSGYWPHINDHLEWAEGKRGWVEGKRGWVEGPRGWAMRWATRAGGRAMRRGWQARRPAGDVKGRVGGEGAGGRRRGDLGFFGNSNKNTGCAIISVIRLSAASATSSPQTCMINHNRVSLVGDNSICIF